MFSPCVCTVVNRLNAFSYDGIPKDGAFLTPVLHSCSSPGSGGRHSVPRPSVTVIRAQTRDSEQQPGERNGNFRRSFVLELWPGAGPGLESCSTLAGKCWLRLGFPVPV